MEKYIYDGKNSLHYELIGDYYPCLTAPASLRICIWGIRRLKYLRQHKNTLYQTLFFTEKLKTHLEEIDRNAEEMFAQLIKQLSAIEGVTETLKTVDQMGWAVKMNSIHNQAKEIVYQELIYE